jgi:NAD(P)-dependent dehydrogenase (short-subunit alcohol dehydrogenase family)
VSDNPFQLDAANIVIAGGGALGTAFANALVCEFAVSSVVLLTRTEPGKLDPRVEVSPVEATDPDSISSAATRISDQLDRVHLLVNTVGLLHGAEVKPEKRLRELSNPAFQQSMAVNALFPCLLAEGFSRTLRHDEPAMFASLSARVGSITDNGMGGWYSYRASKAAHNMLLRTLSREWRVSHRNVTAVALHPGTVDSRLSRPFVSPSYNQRVLQPEESVSHLIDVMRGLSPADSGSFYDWKGETIPW